MVATLLGGVLFAAETSRNALDDKDLAFQRPGFLMETDAKAPPIIRETGADKPMLLIFDRSFADKVLFHDLGLQADLSALADIIIISQDTSRPTITNGITASLSDTDMQLANELLKREPHDGGYPVGYVIIDTDNTVRYSTIDPHYSHNAKEIRKIVKAVL